MSKKKKGPSLKKKGSNLVNQKEPLAKNQKSPGTQNKVEVFQGKVAEFIKDDPSKKLPKNPGGFVQAINCPIAIASLPDPSLITSDEYPDYDHFISNAKKGNLVSFNNFLPKKLPKELEGNLTGKGFAAAVIDTGVYMHDDLKGAIIDRFDCVVEEVTTAERSRKVEKTRVSDIHGHGTHIAGIIAGSNGIAKEGGIVSLKVTTKSSSETTWSSIASALQKVLDYNRDVEAGKLKSVKITVVNLSFNGFDNSDNHTFMLDHTIYQLIYELHEKSIPVVVSGGNYFDYMVHNKEVEPKYGLAYPANCSLTISAGASFGKKKVLFGFNFEKGEIAPFTQRLLSKEYAFFLAPAVCTASAGIYGPKSYTEMTGSSQAAPVITGIILLLQQKFYKNGKLPPVEEIKKKLFEISQPETNYAAYADRFVTRGAARNVMNWYYDDEDYQHIFKPTELP